MYRLRATEVKEEYQNKTIDKAGNLKEERDKMTQPFQF